MQVSVITDLNIKTSDSPNCEDKFIPFIWL